MRLLEVWVQAPLAGALGLTLLHSLWEGAILSAALATALSATRSPRARYAAACAAMIVMLGAFGLTLTQTLPQTTHAQRIRKAQSFPVPMVRTGLDGLNPSNSKLAATAPWLSSFWIGGVWIFSLRHAAGWISLWRLRRRGVCCAHAGWQKELSSLSARLRISRPVLLLESCVADVPMVLGHFRPMILMPIGLLTGLPAGQIEAILLHELAHVRRCDYLTNVLQRFVEGLFFYHPAVWWMSHVIRCERENDCDDMVVAMRGNAHEYAVTLATLEQNRRPSGKAAVAVTGGNLMKRIRRLLYPKGPNSAWTPLFGTVALVLTATVALSAWQDTSTRQTSPSTQSEKRPAATSPYIKWLSQDVAYIITDAERMAFQSLTADAERDKFIEQFWLRRDPTPGTAENEFKTEHYRRITYANQRFRTASGTPGWQTDRGHMYIVYGPPDEIENHPKGTQRTSAIEIWRYWHVESTDDGGYFTFLDRSGGGDYRLAPGTAK